MIHTYTTIRILFHSTVQLSALAQCPSYSASGHHNFIVGLPGAAVESPTDHGMRRTQRQIVLWTRKISTLVTSYVEPQVSSSSFKLSNILQSDHVNRKT